MIFDDKLLQVQDSPTYSFNNNNLNSRSHVEQFIVKYTRSSSHDPSPPPPKWFPSQY